MWWARLISQSLTASSFLQESGGNFFTLAAPSTFLFLTTHLREFLELIILLAYFAISYRHRPAYCFHVIVLLNFYGTACVTYIFNVGCWIGGFISFCRLWHCFIVSNADIFHCHCYRIDHCFAAFETMLTVMRTHCWLYLYWV